MDLPLLPCPGIYWTEPDLMHLADIMGTELMIPVIDGYNFLVSPQQLACLDLVHLTLAIYTEKILQNTVPGTRFEFSFGYA